MDRLVGVGAGAVAEGRKCWRWLFTVADRVTVGLWPIEEKLRVARFVRVATVVGVV
jgi:hypothetical protein